MTAPAQTYPAWERGTMRSMVERDAPTRHGETPRSPSPMPRQAFHARSSRSAILRVVPLSQAGEEM